MNLVKSRKKYCDLCPRPVVNTTGLQTGQHSGFSLVELLISMAIGLILIAMVIKFHVGNLQTSRALLNQDALRQESLALMEIMTREIRLAGFWQAQHYPPDTANPFMHIIIRDGTAYAPFALQISADGSCISLGYDQAAQGQAQVRPKDLIAFRAHRKALEVLRFVNLKGFAQDPCGASAGRWMKLTDPDTIHIDSLQFSSAGSQCLDVQSGEQFISPANATDFPCLSHYSLTTPRRLIARRWVSIRLKASLAHQQMSQSWQRRIAVDNPFVIRGLKTEDRE